jgi:putative transposase
MSHYRRLRIKGGFYFFTVVTYQRQPIFNNEAARICLRQVWIDVRQRWPFDVIAMCLLPDHLHCIWQLPNEDDNFSIRWSLIKRRFVQEYRRTGSCGLWPGVSGIGRNESGIWQRRFWEHNIKDHNDLQRHIDYIHINPIKHGLVEKAEDWPWSTYKKYLSSGKYAGVYYTDMQQQLNSVIGEV